MQGRRALLAHQAYRTRAKASAVVISRGKNRLGASRVAPARFNTMVPLRWGRLWSVLTAEGWTHGGAQSNDANLTDFVFSERMEERFFVLPMN